MFPSCVPYYVRVAEIWRQLIVEGAVPASDPFKPWAEIIGQGGYLEASELKE